MVRTVPSFLAANANSRRTALSCHVIDQQVAEKTLKMISFIIRKNKSGNKNNNKVITPLTTMMMTVSVD